jgi:phage/plasmid-associated DNA primase
MILKIASGGDILIVRGHCQNETDFITHFLPVVLTNDIPNTKSYDDAVGSRVCAVSYIQSLVSGEPIKR